MAVIQAVGQFTLLDINDHVNVTYSVPPPPLNPTPGDLWFNTYNLSELDSNGMPGNNAMYYYDNLFNPSADNGTPKKRYYPKINGYPLQGYWVLGQDSTLKARVYYSDTEPTTGTYNLGDIWVDTKTNNIYVWSTPKAWDSTITYSIGTPVLYTDGHFYKCAYPANAGKLPGIDTLYWNDLGPPTWSGSVIYSINTYVYYSGRYYKSLQSNNSGHTPVSGGTSYWYDAGTVFASWVLNYNSSTLNDVYAAIADDGILSRVEKIRAIIDWQTATIDSVGDYSIGTEGILQKAMSLGVDYASFNSAYTTLRSYIETTIGSIAFLDTTTDTILPAVGNLTGAQAWTTYWKNYFTEKTKILLALQNAPAQFVSFVMDSGLTGSVNLTTNSTAFYSDGYTGASGNTVMLLRQSTIGNDGVYTVVQQTAGGSSPASIPPSSNTPTGSGSVTGSNNTVGPYTVRATPVGSHTYSTIFTWSSNSSVSSGNLVCNFTVFDVYDTGESATIQYSIDGGLSWKSFDGTSTGFYFTQGAHTNSIPLVLTDISKLQIQVTVQKYATKYYDDLGQLSFTVGESYVTISDIEFTSSVSSSSTNWALAKQSSIVPGTVWSVSHGTLYGGKKWKAGVTGATGASIYLIDTNETIAQLPWSAILNTPIYLGGAGSTGYGVTGGTSLDAIAALNGTTGLLKKTGTNTWSLDTTAYSTTNGTVTSVGLSVPTGFSVTGSPVTTSGTLALSFASGYSLPTTTKQTTWDTAYSDRLAWDGGSTGLSASTGRTSLGATTIGSNFFTIVNPSPGVTGYAQVKSDNTVTLLSASDFRTAIGAGSSSAMGTVTSVGLSMPGIFNVTGSPITSSGTLTTTLTTQTANTVFAGPSSGSAAIPSFRTLVATDIPILNQNTTGSAGYVANSVTFTTSGGAAAGTSFNGSSAVTVSYSTIGAQVAGNYVTTDTAQTISSQKTFTGKARFQSDLGFDQGYYLYFGREENFGGSNIGGDDYGYITFDSNNSTYGGGIGETSVLRIGSQNDSATGGNEDSIAIEAAANIYLNSGTSGPGEIYKGVLSNRQPILHSGNYNTYAPSNTGTGATGTWGISITGKLGHTLTFGSGLTGGSFDGSSDKTIAINTLIKVPVRFYYEAWIDPLDKQPIYYVERASTINSIRWYRDDSSTISSTGVVDIKKTSGGTTTTIASVTIGTSAPSSSWTGASFSTSLAAGDYISASVATGSTGVKNLTIQVDIQQTVT